MEGTVKWFNQKKGYGFIAGEDDKEYFVHYSSLDKGTFIRENDKVSFEPNESEKGPIAKEVKLVQKASEMKATRPAEDDDEPAEEEQEAEEEAEKADEEEPDEEEPEDE